MARSNLRAALVATLLAAGLAGCAADMATGDGATGDGATGDGAAGQPAAPNDVSGMWNTPKGLDVGGVSPTSPGRPYP
jgi:hypothetical protein